jgi:hypothetical protein
MDTTVSRDPHQWNSVRQKQFPKRIPYDLRASKAALLSEEIDTAPLTMPSEMQYSEHTKTAYTLG